MEDSKSVFMERMNSRLFLPEFRCRSEECLESALVLSNDRICGKFVFPEIFLAISVNRRQLFLFLAIKTRLFCMASWKTRVRIVSVYGMEIECSFTNTRITFN